MTGFTLTEIAPDANEAVAGISADERFDSSISQVGAPGGGILSVLEGGTGLIRVIAEAPQGQIRS